MTAGEINITIFHLSLEPVFLATLEKSPSTYQHLSAT